jgi:seryl-tRNA synthetase
LLRKRQTRAADAAFAVEIDKRLYAFEEHFENMNAKIDSLKRQVDEKVGPDDVRKLTSDKITKDELDSIIPNEEITQEKMKYLVRDEIENLNAKIADQFK